MLVIHHVENLDNVKLNIKKRKTKKTQILLYDTQRRYNEYISKIKYRNFGSYDNIPHFIVTKTGNIFQLFDSDYWSKTFYDEKIDKKIIKIALENLGWLNKNTINGFLFNWIGDPYRTEPYIKTWRSYHFWDKYTEEQISSLIDLCGFLCEKHDIPKNVVPSQGFFKNAPNFNGIICKSNFSDIYTDINPSFNFNLFLKHAEQKNNRV
jgi:N-acetyl-anhydromuramyl-L-alanine amidase AmpD